MQKLTNEIQYSVHLQNIYALGLLDTSITEQVRFSNKRHKTSNG